ncbi:MAG: hypothetical protein K2Q18_06230 [Bdellovibrionales bacterium]|nr:hypothetical protein [Bdellovibrionales bacterium]
MITILLEEVEIQEESIPEYEFNYAYNETHLPLSHDDEIRSDLLIQDMFFEHFFP